MAEFVARYTAWVEAYPWAASLVGAGLVLLIASVVLLVVRRVLLRVLAHLIRVSPVRWDNALLDRHALRRASWAAPLLVVYQGVPAIPHIPADLESFLLRLITALFALTAFMTLAAVVNAAHDIYAGLPMAHGRPIKGYVQILKIFLSIMAVVLVIAILLEKSPAALLTGIGALTAVILLVFKDTILGLVASLQLASNDMVRIGDWIEMPKYGADGDVVDIALHTVKIQNWDRTITTIPTYKLIEDSFKNWRGMQESGGRRIKRAIHIDMASVRFLDREDIDRFSRFVLLEDYIEGKRRALEDYNREHLPEGSDRILNARRLTNLGTFRAYIQAYLRQHPAIHTEGMVFLVRQLDPGPEGLPLEIYVFSKETAWVVYEGVQADIFDHLLAILPQFGLRVFQKPAGHDLARLGLAASEGRAALEAGRGGREPASVA
jgi:miniconductance mechanosensitive channel